MLLQKNVSSESPGYPKKNTFCVWAVLWLLVMSLWYFVEGQLTLRNTFIVLRVVSVHLRCVELAATHVSQGTCVSTLRTHQ